MTEPNPEPEAPEIESPADPAEQKPAPFDPTSLPPEALAYLKQQVEGEKFKTREGARKAAAEEARKATLAEVAKALGLTDEDEQVDPDELTGRIEQAQVQAFKANVEHQAFRIGTRMGIDVDAALDSNRFMDDLAEAFDEVDPDDPKHIGNLTGRAFADEVERALGAALEKNPRFKPTTGPRPDPSQGARGTAVPDLDGRIAEARKNKDFRTVIALENQKLKFEEKGRRGRARKHRREQPAMAGITALGTTYGLPNYTGLLFQLTPADTPFLSAIGGLTGGGQTTNTEYEWQTFDLRAAAQPAVLEGQDAPTDQERVRAQVKNVTQIHQETVGVSYTKQAAVGRLSGLATAGAQNPVGNELDWQTEQMLKQMARDVEWSFINGAYQLPVDNSTARKTRGLLAAITTNVTDAANGTTSTGTATASTDLITFANTFAGGESIHFTSIGTATGINTNQVYYVSTTTLTTASFKISATRGGSVVDITADGTVVWAVGANALTKAMVDNTIQSAYDNGGLTESATATIICGSAQRRAITNAYLGTGSAGNYVYKELADNVGGVTVTRIQTDFGFLNVMLDRHMPQDTLAVVSLEQCRPVFLEVPGKGHFFSEPLAKTGAKDRVQLYGEVGLEYGNQMAHAKITNLKV